MLPNSTEEPVPMSSGRRLGTCARLERFERISGQSLQVTPDQLFPAALVSIAGAGQSCGDSAAGISESCEKFNNWATFDKVARRYGRTFKVIGDDGVQYDDVAQGQLGTCYFLAALSSIAYSEPQVIENMFVKQELWANNVFTTKWQLNGKETEIVVDDLIPASTSGSIYFVKPSNTGEFWPVILEKAWAKIFSSFKSVEGGLWATPVAEITKAPVVRYLHSQISRDRLWGKLVEATSNKYPMGCGTDKAAEKVGLAASHAYSVFKAYESPQHGKVLDLFNPWNSDNYNGKVPNTHKHDGDFTMTFDEYVESMRMTSVAEVHDGYVVSSKAISAHDQVALEFVNPSEEVFYVSISWPSKRMTRGCSSANPDVTLVVARSDGKGDPLQGPVPSFDVPQETVTVHQGKGSYIVLAQAEFPASADYIQEVVVNVYAPVPVTILESVRAPRDTALAMFGPTYDGHQCNAIMVKDGGLFVKSADKQVGGVPIYTSADDKEFAYYMGERIKKWGIIGLDQLAGVKAGRRISTAQYAADELSCYCRDAEGTVPQLSGSCEGVTAPCSAVEERYCPVSCGPLDACRREPYLPTGNSALLMLLTVR